MLPFLFEPFYFVTGKICTTLGTVIVRTVPNVKTFQILVRFFFKTWMLARFATPFFTQFFCF